MKPPVLLRRSPWLALAAFCILGGAAVSPLRADLGSPGTPRHFSSPDEAVNALVAATKAGDHSALDAIFGPDVKELLSGDARQDALEFSAFAKSVSRYYHVVKEADDRYILDIGPQNWPFPIPLVKRGGDWFFDTVAGKDEIINRRVGEDEITAIGVCRTYVQAQREFAAEDRDGSGVLKYAQRLRSSSGKKDGLYWPASPDEDQSPFGPLIAEVRAEGYGHKEADGQREPFHGYHFRVLTSQGPAAPGGAYNYVINGNMVAGFALVAYPAHWGESGVMTFIVNQWGKVYQRNLGEHSEEVALAMTDFNPDSDWAPVATP